MFTQKDALSKMKAFAGEFNSESFTKMSQQVQLSDGKRWVQFDGQFFRDENGGLVPATPADIVNVEWLATGESLADFIKRKKHSDGESNAPQAAADAPQTAAAAEPASQASEPVMQPIESFGLSEDMLIKLRQAGIKELGTVDLDLLDLPAADIVKLKEALKMKPIVAKQQ